MFFIKNLIQEQYIYYFLNSVEGCYRVDECANYFVEDLERLGRGGFGEVYATFTISLKDTYNSRGSKIFFTISRK